MPLSHQKLLFLRPQSCPLPSALMKDKGAWGGGLRRTPRDSLRQAQGTEGSCNPGVRTCHVWKVVLVCTLALLLVHKMGTRHPP